MGKILPGICLIMALALNSCGQQAGLQEDLALKYLVQLPVEKSAHAPVIILLHGYGSDERDVFELSAAFPKNYLVLSARAPYPLPTGGYEWYEITPVNGHHDGKKEHLENSRNLIEKFISQATAKYKADAKEVYLIGFSQGAIMCYQVGLTAPGKVHGIGVLSGMIFPSLKPLVSNSAALKQLRIFISHGTADNRIPFADGKAAYDYLESIGLKPEFHEYAGMGHAISNDVVKGLLQWLMINGS